ncbi:MAG: hypothetical protein ACU0BS_00590, partial [Hasllibacter sp.]
MHDTPRPVPAPAPVRRAPADLRPRDDEPDGEAPAARPPRPRTPRAEGALAAAAARVAGVPALAALALLALSAPAPAQEAGQIDPDDEPLVYSTTEVTSPEQGTALPQAGPDLPPGVIPEGFVQV